MSGLLPCPFCGSPAELERGNDHHGEWFNLGCSRHWGKNPDDVCVGGRLWYTESELPEAEAIAAWNTRANQSELREALEKMVHAVCGETGFAEAVRHDSGFAYPWPALDDAEASARAALSGSKE